MGLLLQIAANLANDLADFRRGADTPDRMGPTRVAAAGLMTERRLEVGIGTVIAASAVFGLYLAYVGGVAMLVVGALAVLSALAYTGGPWPYGYRGLGEVFVFVFFGLVATGVTAYLQAGRVEAVYLLAAVPMGALITGVLIVNNLRDIPTDRAAGKRTLAVSFGRGIREGRVLRHAGGRGGDPRGPAGGATRRAGGPAAAALRCSWFRRWCARSGRSGRRRIDGD